MTLSSAFRVQAVCISFSWNNGTATTTRYTNNQNPVTVSGVGTFSALPEIEVDHGKQTGGVEDEYVKLRMKPVSPLEDLLLPFAHAPVSVELAYVDVSDPDNTYEVFFAGKVMALLNDAGNQKGVIEVRVAGVRNGIRDVTLGMPALSRCPHQLGDAGCGVNVAVLEELVTVEEVNGVNITVSGLTTTGSSGYWKNGHIRIGENRVKITEYGTGSVFTTAEPPPPSWEGESATMRPGCDKTVATCRNRFNNEDRFFGFGLLIPSEDPRFSSV